MGQPEDLTKSNKKRKNQDYNLKNPKDLLKIYNLQPVRVTGIAKRYRKSNNANNQTKR